MPKAQEARLDLPGIGYLLVEGIDDWHVHHHLRLAGVSFDIGYCGNDDNLLAKLSAVVVEIFVGGDRVPSQRLDCPAKA